MAVKRLPGEPGPGEYSFGAGIMPPPSEGYVPTNRDNLRALFRVNQDPQNINATAAPSFDEDVREQ